MLQGVKESETDCGEVFLAEDQGGQGGLMKGKTGPLWERHARALSSSWWMAKDVCGTVFNL